MKVALVLLLSFTILLSLEDERAIYLKKFSKENRVALVIGNNNYSNFSKLKNSLNDARDIKSILVNKDFDVIFLENASLKEMENGIRKFSSKLKNGGTGMFYYAGHGLEIDGKNYLIPIDANIEAKEEAKYNALAVDMVIDKMEYAKNRLNIIVLDACRHDPFSRGNSGGLAAINNARGMFIAYATAPGSVASDGNGKNGLFTKHLIHEMNNDVPIENVFKKVREKVSEESNGKQNPWTSSSITGEFYFTIPSESANHNSQNNSVYSFETEKANTYSLTINTIPENAKIKILNIVTHYYDGMYLNSGKYDIEISKNGYYTKKGTIELQSNLNIKIDLEKEQTQQELNQIDYSKISNSSVDMGLCKGCHGLNFEKYALGKSKIVKDMTKAEVSKALIGYKNGTYGGAMQGVMKGQVAGYSESDLSSTGIGR